MEEFSHVQRGQRTPSSLHLSYSTRVMQYSAEVGRDASNFHSAIERSVCGVGQLLDIQAQVKGVTNSEVVDTHANT